MSASVEGVGPSPPPPPPPSNGRLRGNNGVRSDPGTLHLMAEYIVSSGYDPVLFHSPPPTRGGAHGYSIPLPMDMEEVFQMDENQFHQTLSDLETCERMSQMLPANHRQSETMIPDSQSCLSSSMGSYGYSDHIKMEVMPLSNVMSSTSSTAVPSSIPYAGEYGFEIAFEQQSKETKSINWTYSDLLNKLYVRMGSTCPIRFQTTLRPPDGCVIRATPVYMKPEHVQEVVTRCPNHTSTKELNENHPAPKHLVRCEHKLAKYLEDRMTGRQSVIVPHEQPQAGADWVTNLFQFMCFSSCVGGLSRRPVQLIFTLEHGSRVCGRQSFEVRICACPGRDRRTDEDSLHPTDRPTGQKSTGKLRTEAGSGGEGAGGGGGGGRGTPSIPRKMQKLEDDEDYYTLTVHGRENYELLCRVNEALELSSRISNYERQLYLKEELDSQVARDELLVCSSIDQGDLSPSNPPKKNSPLAMTLSNGFDGYKQTAKLQYKAQSGLY